MPTKVSDTVGLFAPTALIKEKGASLTGILQSKKMTDTSFGPKPVYLLKVEDADCKFSQGKGVEVEPDPGAIVEFFAPTRLERQLVQVAFGKRVKIVCLGQNANAKGANKPWVFDVTVFNPEEK